MFDRVNFNAILALLLAPLVLNIQGCAISVAPLPEEKPLVRTFDARVGLAYAPKAKLMVYSDPLLRIEFGKASEKHFSKAFQAIFAETINLPNWPPWWEANLDIDGVIELEDANLNVTLGNDLNKPDVITVSYRICLSDATRTKIKCWTPQSQRSYQRRPFECLNLSQCIGPQIDVAVREAVAVFLLDVERDPEVSAWVSGLRI